MITITGASGKTGFKTASILLDKGIPIRVLGRNAGNLSPLVERGAEALVGDQADVGFLQNAFKGSDAVYLLIPPKLDADDILAFYRTLGSAAAKALQQSRVKKVVFLSSLGAEHEHGTGPVAGLHIVEEQLKALPDLDLTILRPGYFMENTLWNIPLVKSQKINGGSTDPDTPICMIATKDIAQKAAEALLDPTHKGLRIVDLWGDYLSYSEATKIIGTGVGMGPIPYVRFPDSDALAGLMGFGLSESVAASYVELSHALAQGKVKPTQGGDPSHPVVPTRFADWVRESFVPAFAGAQ